MPGHAVTYQYTFTAVASLGSEIHPRPNFNLSTSIRPCIMHPHIIFHMSIYCGSPVIMKNNFMWPQFSIFHRSDYTYHNTTCQQSTSTNKFGTTDKTVLVLNSSQKCTWLPFWCFKGIVKYENEVTIHSFIHNGCLTSHILLVTTKSQDTKIEW